MLLFEPLLTPPRASSGNMVVILASYDTEVEALMTTNPSHQTPLKTLAPRGKCKIVVILGWL